jgi:hypothetical protein
MNAVKPMKTEHQQQQTTPILSKIKPLVYIGSALTVSAVAILCNNIVPMPALTAFLPRMSALHTEKVIMPELHVVETFIL